MMAPSSRRVLLSMNRKIMLNPLMGRGGGWDATRKHTTCLVPKSGQGIGSSAINQVCMELLDGARSN